MTPLQDPEPDGWMMVAVVLAIFFGVVTALILISRPLLSPAPAPAPTPGHARTALP